MEIIAENFPNQGKETDIQNQKVPNKMNPKEVIPRHIIKLSKVKDKERILKVAREKLLVTYKETPHLPRNVKGITLN